MRIALIVHDFSRRLGHGRYTVELAERFRHDHDVHVFANTIDPEDAGSVRVHRVPAIRANALTTILTFPLPAMLRVGSGWDVIHAQGLTSGRFNVVTAHICNAGWARAQRAATVARTWRQRAFEHVVTALEGSMYRHSAGAEVIAISNQLRHELAEFYDRRERVSVIHHGVDTTHFRPAAPESVRALRRELALPADRPIALFVGDLRKGGVVALEVLAQVSGLHLLMVSGSDTEPYRAHAAALGVSERVTFEPAARTIQRYYAAADMFLFPSPYDAFGMVALEAMASALPVVMSRQAGASELIEPERDGLIVDKATDIGAFVDHVRRLTRNPELRTSMGAAARRTAERHSWDAVARETMRIYERAVAGRNGQPA